MSGGAGGPLGFGDDPADGEGSQPSAAGPTAEEPPASGSGPRQKLPGATTRARLPGVILLLAGVALLVVVGVNTLRTHGVSSTGPPVGRVAPRFAAPLALGAREGDVNVAQHAGQGAAGAHAACSVRGSGILNSCDLTRTRPAALVFFATGEGRCTGEVDALARAGRAVPEVALAAVAVRSDRGALRGLVTSHGWSFPVAYDRDGALANLYGVAVCPQVTYLLPGGVVVGTTVGELGQAALTGRLRALVSEARRRGAAA